MNVAHDIGCAKRHIKNQVPIDTLRDSACAILTCDMGRGFRDAFVWHMDQADVSLADIVRRTGVSRDVLNKLLAREGSSTTAENAVLIASYFGKSLEDFIRCEAVPQKNRIPSLALLLDDEERRLVEAMIRGVIAERERK